MPPGAERRVRLTAVVHGRVHGVGFRWWTRSRALELGLAGTATNCPDGTVEVVAQGRRRSVETLLTLLSEDPPRDPPPGAAASWRPRPGTVSRVEARWERARGDLTGFREATRRQG